MSVTSSYTDPIMCTRVYCQKAKEEFEKNVGKPGVISNYDDSRHTFVEAVLVGIPDRPLLDLDT